MAELKVLHKQISFETRANKVNYFEIREDCKQFLAESGVKDGILTVSSPHTTCAVYFDEMDHDTDPLGDYFLQADLNKGLNKIFPKQLAMDDYYKYPGPIHRQFSKDVGGAFATNGAELLNGDAHLKSTLIGSDKTFIIKDGELQIGRFGYIFFVDFDGNKSRKRNCNLMIMGK